MGENWGRSRAEVEKSTGNIDLFGRAWHYATDERRSSAGMQRPSNAAGFHHGLFGHGWQGWKEPGGGMTGTAPTRAVVNVR